MYLQLKAAWLNSSMMHRDNIWKFLQTRTLRGNIYWQKIPNIQETEAPKY